MIKNSVIIEIFLELCKISLICLLGIQNDMAAYSYFVLNGNIKLIYLIMNGHNAKPYVPVFMQHKIKIRFALRVLDKEKLVLNMHCLTMNCVFFVKRKIWNWCFLLSWKKRVTRHVFVQLCSNETRFNGYYTLLDL